GADADLDKVPGPLLPGVFSRVELGLAVVLRPVKLKRNAWRVKAIKLQALVREGIDEKARGGVVLKHVEVHEEGKKGAHQPFAFEFLLRQAALHPCELPPSFRLGRVDQRKPDRRLLARLRRRKPP